jgi:hypothetical protein
MFSLKLQELNGPALGDGPNMLCKWKKRVNLPQLNRGGQKAFSRSARRIS